MIGMFSWKERSKEIFKTILDEKNIPRNNEDDEDVDSDFDDIKTADRTAFEKSSVRRQQTLKLNPEQDLRLRKWRELTDIDTTPKLPPRNTASFSYSAQRVIKQKSVSPKIAPRMNVEHPKLLNVDKLPTGARKISFKFQYLVITERLKVTIQQAANLFEDGKDESSIVANAKVSLMPGKVQQQLTSIVKGSKNPEFNAVLFFTGFSLHDVHRMSLRVKVNGRQGNRGSLKTLGVVSVPLDDFDLIGETCIEESLNTRF